MHGKSKDRLERLWFVVQSVQTSQSSVFVVTLLLLQAPDFAPGAPSHSTEALVIDALLPPLVKKSPESSTSFIPFFIKSEACLLEGVNRLSQGGKSNIERMGSSKVLYSEKGSAQVAV